MRATTQCRKLLSELRKHSEEDARVRLQEFARARRTETDRCLLELLQAKSVWLRKEVLEALWEFGRLETARTAARRLLEAKNWDLRDTAIEAIGEVGNRADVPRIIQVLENDGYWGARVTAVFTLGDLGTAKAMLAVRRALIRDRNWCVRADAAIVLGCTEDRRHVPLLERALNRDPEPAARASIAHGLVLLGETQHWQVIRDLLAGDDEWHVTYIRCYLAIKEMAERGEDIPQDILGRVSALATSTKPGSIKANAAHLLKELAAIQN